MQGREKKHCDDILFFLISSSSSFGTAPKIEERGQVLWGQALQVPMLLSFTIMGTDSAGTSSAGPMNQIERVQYPKMYILVLLDRQISQRK